MLLRNLLEAPQEMSEAPQGTPRRSRASGRHSCREGTRRGRCFRRTRPSGAAPSHSPPALSPTHSSPRRPRVPAPACSLLLPGEMGLGRLCSPREARGDAGLPGAGLPPPPHRDPPAPTAHSARGPDSTVMPFPLRCGKNNQNIGTDDTGSICPEWNRRTTWPRPLRSRSSQAHHALTRPSPSVSA